MASENFEADEGFIKATTDLDSTSASDSDTLYQSPSSNDREILREQDEVEHLLTGSVPRFDSNFRSKNANADGYFAKRKDQHRRVKQRRRLKIHDNSPSLVYEMEEGFKDTSTNTSTDSLLLNDDKFRKIGSTTASSLRWTFLSISVAALFAVLAYGAYRASRLLPLSPHLPQALSNGTHIFEATTILISLDGFRADFLQRGLTPSLNAFIASGVSPRYMLPSFPSVTFPNHYTLVTGLYPESHGIVGNQFWDPKLQEEFYYTDTATSMQPKWWEGAEPLWVTAEKQGLKTAIHMWPGSEAHIHNMDPTYLDVYKATEKLPKKVDRILGLLDMEKDQRPQLIAAYVPDVDRDGHKYGPNSTEIRATIASADQMLTFLIEGLLQRNLTEIVNLVVVSDHGMATMSAHRMVQLDDLIDMSLVDHIDGWPLRGLRLKNPNRDLPVMYKQLSDAAKKHGTFKVYTRETMPERYHFSRNPRIAPLWVVPETGWLVIERDEFDIAKAIAAGEEFHPRGIHGFDHEHPLMRAIFIARGPAFPHAANSRIPVFQNIEVYNIVCDSLGIIPHKNNGTIRLPMTTEGLHSDFSEHVEIPADDPADLKSHIDEDSHVAEDSHTSSPVPDQPIQSDTKDQTESQEVEDKPEKEDSWWDYLRHKLDQAKDWAKGIIDSVKNNSNNNKDASESDIG